MFQLRLFMPRFRNRLGPQHGGVAVQRGWSVRIERIVLASAYLLIAAPVVAQQSAAALPGLDATIVQPDFTSARAAYEAELAVNRAERARAEATEARYRHDLQRFSAASRRAPAHVAPPVSAAADPGTTPVPSNDPGREVLVQGKQVVCMMRGGTAATGSLIVRTKARRVCYDSKELARSRSDTDRDAREYVRPKAGNDIY